MLDWINKEVYSAVQFGNAQEQYAAALAVSISTCVEIFRGPAFIWLSAGRISWLTRACVVSTSPLKKSRNLVWPRIWQMDVILRSENTAILELPAAFC
jgi:hypothetical protein